MILIFWQLFLLFLYLRKFALFFQFFSQQEIAKLGKFETKKTSWLSGLGVTFFF
jgi:hypothetical protein